MKLIMPEAAQIQFPDIQLQPPESLPPRPENPDFPDLPPEERPPYQPNPLPPPQFPQYPGEDTGGGGSSGGCCVPDWLMDLLQWAGEQWDQLKKHILGSGGAYIRVDVVANTGGYNINLKNENDVEGNICTFGDDKIKGLDKEEFVESISDELDDYVEDYLGDDASGEPQPRLLLAFRSMDQNYKSPLVLFGFLVQELQETVTLLTSSHVINHATRK